MTSSLVGSEMCIRDRTQIELVGTVLNENVCRGKGAVRRRLAWHDGFLSCLLYTSDAADDM
eukprot:11579538-Prorocentrum_lima.AAC.1